jgi:hypothetical protein
MKFRPVENSMKSRKTFQKHLFQLFLKVEHIWGSREDCADWFHEHCVDFESSYCLLSSHSDSWLNYSFIPKCWWNCKRVQSIPFDSYSWLIQIKPN